MILSVLVLSICVNVALTDTKQLRVYIIKLVYRTIMFLEMRQQYVDFFSNL